MTITPTTNSARFDFNENIVVPKLWEGNGDDAELLRLGVSGDERQHFVLS